MRLTPEEIEARRFRLAPNGYECEAVDRFLAEITDALRNEPADGPDSDEFTRVGQEIAGLLRAARASAGAVRAEADGLAASVRSRAELEAGDIRREAETYLEQSKLVLAAAEAQAEVVLRDAERQTAEVVAASRAGAEAEAGKLIAAAETQVAEILRAERSAQQRLLSARRDLQQAIDRLSGDPEQAILDLTDADPSDPEPAAQAAVSPRPEPDTGTAPVAPTAASGRGVADHVDTSDPSADPLLRMVRAAVGRAAEHSADEPEGKPVDRGATAV